MEKTMAKVQAKMRPLSAAFSGLAGTGHKRHGDWDQEHRASSGTFTRLPGGEALLEADDGADEVADAISKLSECKSDIHELKAAIKRCTDKAQELRAGRCRQAQVHASLETAAALADKCCGWRDELEGLLFAVSDDEALLASILKTNDDLQVVLGRWQTLLSLGIEDGGAPDASTAGSRADAQQAASESYITEVGADVLAGVGGGPEPAAAAGPRGGPDLRAELAEMRGRCEDLQVQVAAAESLRTAALAEAAAVHAQEINQTKGLAVCKIKELMSQIQEQEEVQASLQALRRAATERAEAAEKALGEAKKARAAAEAAAAQAVQGQEEVRPAGETNSGNAGKDAEILAAQEKEAAAQAESGRLAAELEQARAKAEAYAAELEAAGAQVKKLRAAVHKLELQVVEAGQESAQASADAEARVAAKDAEVAALQGKLATAADALEAAEGYKQRMEAAEKAAERLKLELRKEGVLRKKAYNQIREMKGNIRVLCRIRPAAVGNGREDETELAVEALDEFTLGLEDAKLQQARKYEFDQCFVPAATQEEVYEETKALLQSAMDGYNVCIFAYGQTGSGKTHTITGTPEAPGIIPRAMEEVFARDPAVERVAVSCYMLELYQDSLLDLLGSGASSQGKLAIKRDPQGAVIVEGAEVKAASNKAELEAIFQRGLEGRKVAATRMNSESSRSHLVFTITLEVENLSLGTKASSKLTFVDLAGSERVARSGAINEKNRLDEARAINKSLSALGDVVAALTSGDSFVPYRNHKLTQLMSDSLGGNAKTLMVVNVSPLASDAGESKSSLEYASRVKQVTNENSRSFETREIQKLKAEIARLRAGSTNNKENKGGSGGGSPPTGRG